MKALEHKIPPPMLALLIGVVMGMAARQFPALAFAFPWGGVVGFAIGAIGMSFSFVGLWTFHRAKTTVNPVKPDTASTLVTTGVYRLSRNPMYVGLFCALTGWALYLANFVAFLFLPLFILYMNRFQIGPEERALTTIFGEEYAAYKKAVRRWV